MLNSAEDKDLRILQSVTMVGFQKPNWGRHSGMNSILNVVPVERIFMKKPVPGPVYRAWKPFRRWFYARNPYYEINSAWLEFKVAMDWFRKQNRIYHFLSGENEFMFSGALKRIPRNNKLVCTFHAIEQEACHVSRLAGMQQLDAVVVVAGCMLEYFHSIFGAERVWRIPHGIDTTYWQPAETKARNRSPQILFVGSHLRDFDVLRRVIEISSARDTSIRFHAVISREDAQRLADLKNLNIYPRLEDSELRRLYQTSDIFFCPLLECTASNSLLEALACGTPIVTTDVGSAREYVSDENAILTKKGDAEQMAEALLQLISDDSRRDEMSMAARKRALELDWMAIAHELAEVYRKIL